MRHVLRKNAICQLITFALNKINDGKDWNLGYRMGFVAFLNQLQACSYCFIRKKISKKIICIFKNLFIFASKKYGDNMRGGVSPLSHCRKNRT